MQGLSVLHDAFETCAEPVGVFRIRSSRALSRWRLPGWGELDEALGAVWKTGRRPPARREDGQEWYVPSCSASKAKSCCGKNRGSSASAAEDCFNQAGEMAREQGALFWELRVALSVARLRAEPGSTEGSDTSSRASLRSVHGRLWNEGYAVRDRVASIAVGFTSRIRAMRRSFRHRRPSSCRSSRGLAGPGLLAHVLVGKFGDHLSLHRQAEIFARNVKKGRRDACAGLIDLRVRGMGDQPRPAGVAVAREAGPAGRPRLRYC